MKRKLATILSVVMIVASIAACAPASPSPAPASEAPKSEAPASSAPAASEPASSAPAASAPASPAAEGLKIGVTLYARDQFISLLEQGIKDAAAKVPGATIDVQDAQNDVQRQLDQVSSFAAQKVDVIIVNLVNTDIAADLLKNVGDIPVIFVNRRPEDSVLREGKDAYVGSNEYDAGSMQAAYLSELFKAQNKTDLSYILFQGQLGLENTNQRTESVKKELEAAGFKLTKVFEDTAEWDRVKAMDKMQTLLATSPKYDVVICNNDEMALGVIEALKLTNVSPMPPVCGIDATADALVAIENGTMAMSVFQDASGQGAKCIELASLAAKGELKDKFGWVPFKPVTKANVAEFKK